MPRKSTRAIIGIVGGMGPYAGLDFNQKIFDNTVHMTEQDHLEVYLMSAPGSIADRSAFLLDPVHKENPARGIFTIIRKLEKAGATVIGIPCNTSHSPAILDEVKRLMKKHRMKVKLLDIVVETFKEIVTVYPETGKVGLLATRGTYHSGVYGAVGRDMFAMEVLSPELDGQNEIHRAIYDPEIGIKHFCNPINRDAITLLRDNAIKLVEKGAELIIMGCTEIPLALRSQRIPVPLIDPNIILARALIRESEPHKLKQVRIPNPLSAAR